MFGILITFIVFTFSQLINLVLCDVPDTMQDTCKQIVDNKLINANDWTEKFIGIEE